MGDRQEREARVAVHASADVSPMAHVADTASVWHLAQVREDASIGERVVVGRGAYIGAGVSIGDNSKIQNYALVYEPAVVGPGVFIGPAVVFTNDRTPRAVDPWGHQKGASDWEAVGVSVLEGASIGARAVCIAPVTIGRWAMVGAGAVVVADVPDFALVVGIPARRIGWVGRAGSALAPVEGFPDLFRCPITGATYHVTSAGLLVEGESV